MVGSNWLLIDGFQILKQDTRILKSQKIPVQAMWCIKGTSHFNYMWALNQQILWQNPCYSKRTWWFFAGLGFPAFQWPSSNFTFIWFVGLQISFLVGCWTAVTNLLGWSRWTKEAASYQTPIPKSSQIYTQLLAHTLSISAMLCFHVLFQLWFLCNTALNLFAFQLRSYQVSSPPSPQPFLFYTPWWHRRHVSATYLNSTHPYRGLMENITFAYLLVAKFRP